MACQRDKLGSRIVWFWFDEVIYGWPGASARLGATHIHGLFDREVRREYPDCRVSRLDRKEI